jgi:hypothetical protein
MKILLTAFLSLVCMSVFGQIAFYRSFTALGDDYGQGVVELPDTSYLITGSSSSFTNHMEVFLLKLDSTGNKLWSNHFGGEESDLGRKVFTTPNGDIFISGYTNSFGTGDFDFYLLKVTSDGVLVWEKNYGSPDWERVNDAIPTADNGVVMVGERNGAVNSNVATHVVRVNNSGDTMWTSTFSANSRPYTVNSYQDSLYVVTGSVYLPDSAQHKGLLTILNDSGDVIFQDTISPTGNSIFHDAIIDGDSIQIVGRSYPNVGDDFRLLRVTYNLATQTVLSLISLQGVGSWSGDLITEYGSNNLRYLGYQIVASFTVENGPDLHFGRYDINFNSISQVVQLEYTGEELGRDMIGTRDGGAISVGYTTLGGNGSGNVYVLKIGPGETYPDTQIGTNFETIVDLVEINKEVSFSYYPNPTDDVLHIVPNDIGIRQITVRDLSGKKMLQTSDLDVSLLEFAPGIYFLDVELLNGQSQAVKVIRR